MMSQVRTQHCSSTSVKVYIPLKMFHVLFRCFCHRFGTPEKVPELNTHYHKGKVSSASMHFLK